MRLTKEFEKLTYSYPPRGYIGCSIIGHPCDRFIWLNKYGTLPSEGTLQKERIFERGRLEEERIFGLIRKLKNISILSTQEEMHNSVLQGSCDGILRDADGTSYILEIKTMHNEAFKTLSKKGLYKSNSLYWAQCQAYMHLSGTIRKTIFLGINKNDEAMYEERIDYDPIVGEGLLAKAQRISDTPSAPEGIKNRGKKPQACFWCRFHQQCYGENQ